LKMKRSGIRKPANIGIDDSNLQCVNFNGKKNRAQKTRTRSNLYKISKTNRKRSLKKGCPIDGTAHFFITFTQEIIYLVTL